MNMPFRVSCNARTKVHNGSVFTVHVVDEEMTSRI